MLIVGLTGNIGSGKTIVSGFFEKKGAAVIDADNVARELVACNKTAWREIVDFFGEEILLADGNIARKKLGDIVFNNEDARLKLNSILHPKVLTKFAKITEKLKNKEVPPEVLVYDVPLLLETGMDKTVDIVVLVYATKEVLYKRLKNRDGLTESEIDARLSVQMPMEEKKRFADYIIDNNGNFIETEKQVNELWKVLTDKK